MPCGHRFGCPCLQTPPDADDAQAIFASYVPGFHIIINYTSESVWSSCHSRRYSAMAESDSSAGRYVADRTETATATSLAVTSEYALSKTRSSVVWSLAVQAPPNLEPCAFSV